MLTPDLSHIKILDFGVGKVRAALTIHISNNFVGVQVDGALLTHTITFSVPSLPIW